MPRASDIPKCPENWQSPKPEAGRSYEIELMTPMVGGGVETRVNDPSFPIRPTAIRGQLRHWWRLVRGHSLGDRMWQREEEIFGSTEFPSPVTVNVKALTKAEQFDSTDKQKLDPFGPVAYALFASIENNHQVTREGLRFQITVQTANSTDLARRRKAQNERRMKARQPVLAKLVDSIETDIDEALSAWLTFGGIGGRTRRGCGAVHCHNLGGSVPKLSARTFVGPAQSSAIEAWKKSLEAYREFRQTPRGKRHSKTLRNGKKVHVPGRSHWPEADSIRKITGCSLKPLKGTPPSGVPADEDIRDHSTPVVPNSLLPAFPKAILGLPINFHFADGPDKKKAADAKLDPKDVQLYPLLPAGNGRMEKAERMASPIITRPLWMKGQWHPAIIILDQRLPETMQVRLEGQNASLTGNLVQNLPLSCVIDVKLGAIAPMRGKASAIEALIDFLGTKGFTEVTG